MKGKNTIKLLIILSFITTNVFSQIVDPYGIGSSVSLGRTVFSGIRDKKKLKNIENSISDTVVNGVVISMLRVKENKIISNAKYYILKIQDQLNGFYTKYQSNQHIGYIDDGNNDDISSIESLDYTWPVDYYKKELITYRNYEIALTKMENKARDSIGNINRIKLDDSLPLIRKEHNDSSQIGTGYARESTTKGFWPTLVFLKK